MIDETTPTEAANQEKPMVHGVSLELFPEDEGYLLEGDELTVKAETRVGTYREFSSQEDKTVPKRKKTQGGFTRSK